MHVSFNASARPVTHVCIRWSDGEAGAGRVSSSPDRSMDDRRKDYRHTAAAEASAPTHRPCKARRSRKAVAVVADPTCSGRKGPCPRQSCSRRSHSAGPEQAPTIRLTNKKN